MNPDEMSRMSDEPQWWADLCDRCGKCCEAKLDGKPSGVACPELGEDRLCRNYETRFERVPSCKQVTPENVLKLGLPETCAYVRWAKDIRPWKLENPGHAVLIPFDQFVEQLKDWR